MGTTFGAAAAEALTFGAGLLAPWLSLPEALLRETGLFLIAYAALVGWLGTRQAMPSAIRVVASWPVPEWSGLVRRWATTAQ